MTATPDHRQHAARVAGLFDAVSGDYDGVGVDFFQPIAAGLLQAVPLRTGERVLDVGSGRGAVLLRAASEVGPSGQVVGIDISPAMVEATRALASQQSLANVEVHVDDAQTPSLAAEPFDVITCCLVLFFLAAPADALRSWASLLAPGGRLGITTFGDMDPRWAHVDEVFTPYLPPAMRDARTSGKAGPFSSDAGMESLVSSAGYVDVATRSGSVPVRFADAGQWHSFTWSTGQRAMWLSIPEDQRAGVRAEAERRLLAHAAADGSITFEQAVRHTVARRPVTEVGSTSA